jgi:hypothetical protein
MKIEPLSVNSMCSSVNDVLKEQNNAETTTGVIKV